MDRRKILLGSGAAFATVLAGCASSLDQTSETHNDEKANENDTKDDKSDEKENKKGVKNDEKGDEKGDENKEKKNDKKEIPGFDRDAFQIDSDVIQVKEVTYRKQKLNVRVMLTTDDRDELVEGLRAVAPGLDHGVHDAEEFLATLKEIKFTLLDENKNRVFEFFLDVAWLREFLNGDLTNDELVAKIHDGMEQR